MRFTALDSLRGICAIMVALYHFPGAGRGELTTDVLLVLFIAAIATLTYRFVENPSRAYLNRLGWSWPQRAPATEKLVDGMSRGRRNSDRKRSPRIATGQLALIHELNVTPVLIPASGSEHFPRGMQCE